MIDQSKKVLAKIIDHLRKQEEFVFAGINGQPEYTGVFRAGDDRVDPDRMPVGIYLDCHRQSATGDRQICDLAVYIRMATRLDPAGDRLDAMAEAVEAALPAAAEGLGLVPGGTSIELADGYRVMTMEYQLYLIGEQ